VSRAQGLRSAQAASLRNLDFRLTWSVVVKCCHAMIDHSEGGGEKSRGGLARAFIRVVPVGPTLLTRLPAFSPSISGSPRPTGPAQWRLRQTTTSEHLSGRREYVHG